MTTWVVHVNGRALKAGLPAITVSQGFGFSAPRIAREVELPPGSKLVTFDEPIRGGIRAAVLCPEEPVVLR